MTEEKEPKNAFYYLSKAGARVGPFPLGSAVKSLDEMQEMVDDYVIRGGYEKLSNLLIYNPSGSPDLVDIALVTHYLRLYVHENRGNIQEGILSFRERYSENGPNLIDAIENARHILDLEGRK